MRSVMLPTIIAMMLSLGTTINAQQSINKQPSAAAAAGAPVALDASSPAKNTTVVPKIVVRKVVKLKVNSKGEPIGGAAPLKPAVRPQVIIDGKVVLPSNSTSNSTVIFRKTLPSSGLITAKTEEGRKVAANYEARLKTIDEWLADLRRAPKIDLAHVEKWTTTRQELRTEANIAIRQADELDAKSSKIIVGRDASSASANGFRNTRWWMRVGAQTAVLSLLSSLIL